MKQNLLEQGGEIDKSTIIFVDFNTSAVINKISRHKISKIENLTSTVNQLDLTITGYLVYNIEINI